MFNPKNGSGNANHISVTIINLTEKKYFFANKYMLYMHNKFQM